MTHFAVLSGLISEREFCRGTCLNRARAWKNSRDRARGGPHRRQVCQLTQLAAQAAYPPAQGGNARQKARKSWAFRRHAQPDFNIWQPATAHVGRTDRPIWHTRRPPPGLRSPRHAGAGRRQGKLADRARARIPRTNIPARSSGAGFLVFPENFGTRQQLATSANTGQDVPTRDQHGPTTANRCRLSTRCGTIRTCASRTRWQLVATFLTRTSAPLAHVSSVDT